MQCCGDSLELKCLFVCLFSETFSISRFMAGKDQSWNSTVGRLVFLPAEETPLPYFDTWVPYAWINAAVVFTFTLIFLLLLSFFTEMTFQECEGNSKIEEHIFHMSHSTHWCLSCGFAKKQWARLRLGAAHLGGAGQSSLYFYVRECPRSTAKAYPISWAAAAISSAWKSC